MFLTFLIPSRTLTFLALIFLATCTQASGQDVPKIDLLKLKDSKPILSPAGEGVTSYKITDLFKRGTTKIVPFQPKFKVQLPTGYTLLNNMIYGVETDSVFSAPIDVEFCISSADTAELFEKIRILRADPDYADIETPQWVDTTVMKTGDPSGYLTGLQLEQRLPNFKSRTLHAFVDRDVRVFAVVVRDPNLARDQFTANLKVTSSDVETVEGQTFSRIVKVTNSGPDAATTVTVRITHALEVKAMKVTGGYCRGANGDVFCRIPKLEKGKSVDVEIVERAPWIPEGVDASDGRISRWNTRFETYVGAAERDSIYEDNQVVNSLKVLAGTNKSPTLRVTNLKLFEMFPGPSPDVPIRVATSDPDGSISKVEFFEEGRLLGVGNLVGPNEYEFVYKQATFGSHILRVKVTDNLGRDLEARAPEFFVNGLADVEIVSPKKGEKRDKLTDDLKVTIRASNSMSPLKKVSLQSWGSDATPIGNDLYTYVLPACGRKCMVQASAFDANGVETRSETVEFTVMEAPRAELSWFDGEYRKDFTENQSFSVREMILAGVASPQGVGAAKVVKLEVFKDGILFCSEDVDDSIFAHAECEWRNIQPGQYKLQVVATDEDGAVGKSKVITVTITRP